MKTAIEESGTNMLYLIFGFLEWYEDDSSEQPRYAPLGTFPVAMERNGAKGKGFVCTIESSGDDLAHEPFVIGTDASRLRPGDTNC